MEAFMTYDLLLQPDEATTVNPSHLAMPASLFSPPMNSPTTTVRDVTKASYFCLLKFEASKLRI